ncbi:hypothetical protein L227DRAFT_578945 [Lentinus tigrinus ALCF2SS1-6]|uniref:Uncharacterized protein n=2 Tax=Lentinus tigrinus TaxID=5365 RepID=A0A5C2RYW7_9APHY|nr:hypothetical protein L227DRAFT_578945 [Lentinus tigrinus ALCF2SS1-6]
MNIHATILEEVLRLINEMSPGICVPIDHANRLLKESEELCKAFKQRDFKTVLYTEALYTPVELTGSRDNFFKLSARDQEAAVAAW